MRNVMERPRPKCRRTQNRLPDRRRLLAITVAFAAAALSAGPASADPASPSTAPALTAPAVASQIQSLEKSFDES